MAASSRGQIEELSVTFNNETEKNISFEADGVPTKNFSGPPVVKLASISSGLTSGGGVEQYHQPYLQYSKDQEPHIKFEDNGLGFYSYWDFREESFDWASYTALTGITADIVSESILEEKLLIEPDGLHIKPTFGNLNQMIGKSPGVELCGHVIVPFDNTDFDSGGEVYVYFQLCFWMNFGTIYGLKWGNDSAEDIQFYFLSEEGFTTRATGIPSSGTNQVNLSYKLEVAGEGDTPQTRAWKDIKGGSNVENFSVDATEIAAKAMSDIFNDRKYTWFRLTLKNGTEGLNLLKALQIRNRNGFSNGQGAGIYRRLNLANTQVIAWPNGATPWEIEGEAEKNANIGVTFTNVTLNGMKIMTTAPFTGTIRYLVSING